MAGVRSWLWSWPSREPLDSPVGLKAPGLRGVELVVSYDHPGLTGRSARSSPKPHGSAATCTSSGTRSITCRESIAMTACRNCAGSTTGISPRSDLARLAVQMVGPLSAADDMGGESHRAHADLLPPAAIAPQHLKSTCSNFSTRNPPAHLCRAHLFKLAELPAPGAAIPRPSTNLHLAAPRKNTLGARHARWRIFGPSIFAGRPILEPRPRSAGPFDGLSLPPERARQATVATDGCNTGRPARRAIRPYTTARLSQNQMTSIHTLNLTRALGQSKIDQQPKQPIEAMGYFCKR